jgi:energy-coupling factor transporter ATP-binding protein EcfA2
MATLNINEFSCIHDATFTLAPVNVIIGPQGSGKSVTTKLFYFFSDILSHYTQCAERGESIEVYKRIVSKQFSVWFPPSAWGTGRFNISYVAGSFSTRILRRTSGGRVSDEVSITFSEWFVNNYKITSDLLSKSIKDDSLDIHTNLQINDSVDRLIRVRQAVHQRLLTELGDEYLSQQTFIPAGRAFFTSIGRLVAGFEQAGSLDPVTIKFARLLANLRDRNTSRLAPSVSRLGIEFMDRRKQFMSELFGGEIKFEDDAEFVETADGRKVPFSSLSSGQQELLPMWTLMDYLNQLDAFRYTSARLAPTRSNRRARELIYIEEPEAHLFPSAQSLLMEFLIGSVVSERNRRSLIITTHSPYIMAKLNVFLKAGQLSRRKRRNQDINEVVPRECWLQESQLSAFSIEDGSLKDIIDEYGLIDATYLDQISEDTARDFSRLLKIESEIKDA